MLSLALIKTKARPISLLLATLAFVAELRSAAAEPSVAIASANLQVDADPNCTSPADVIARVRARSPRVRFVADGSGLSIRVQVSIAASGTVMADVTLASSETKPSLRHVHARTCTEAADAVALIIAVTLDPSTMDNPTNGSTSTAGGAPGAAAVRSDSSDNEHASRSAVTASPPKPHAKPPAPGSTDETQRVNAANGSTGSGSRVTFGAQLAAESLVGIAPGVMPGVAVFAIASLESPSLWSPALVLGGHHAWRTDVQEPGGMASFTLDAATLDVCPLRLRLGPLDARPCVSALFGRSAARATDTFDPAAESVRPFGVVGAAAVMTAHLGWLLEASGRLAVGANLVRDSFEFSPAIFHTVPPISAAASLGIGLRWR